MRIMSKVFGLKIEIDYYISLFCSILCHETTASGLVVIEIVLFGLVLNKIKQKETLIDLSEEMSHQLYDCEIIRTPHQMFLIHELLNLLLE